jgi:hypothetical protein
VRREVRLLLLGLRRFLAARLFLLAAILNASVMNLSCSNYAHYHLQEHVR